MTAHELARKLLAGPDLEVHIAYPKGDYWCTVVSPKARSAEEVQVRHSSYARDDVLIDEEDEDEDEENPEGRVVIAIRG